jgi:hypothetical protein
MPELDLLIELNSNQVKFLLPINYNLILTTCCLLFYSPGQFFQICRLV